MCVTAVKRLKHFLVLFTRCNERFSVPVLSLVKFYFPFFQTYYRTLSYPKQRKIYILNQVV